MIVLQEPQAITLVKKTGVTVLGCHVSNFQGLTNKQTSKVLAKTV